MVGLQQRRRLAQRLTNANVRHITVTLRRGACFAGAGQLVPVPVRRARSGLSPVTHGTAQPSHGPADQLFVHREKNVDSLPLPF